MTYEHLKIALDDEDTAELLHTAFNRLATASLPEQAAEAIMAAHMTALAKRPQPLTQINVPRF